MSNLGVNKNGVKTLQKTPIKTHTESKLKLAKAKPNTETN